VIWIESGDEDGTIHQEQIDVLKQHETDRAIAELAWAAGLSEAMIETLEAVIRWYRSQRDAASAESGL
jgi:hypothetical protein